MRKRTAFRIALVAVPLAGVVGLILLLKLGPRLVLALMESLNEEGPWGMQFPSEARSTMLSQERPLEGRRSDHAVGNWFAQGIAVLRGKEGECLALNSDLTVLGQVPMRYRCHDVVNLGGDAEILVALVAESASPFGQMAVGLSDQGIERWRFQPSDSISLEVAAPLYDEAGLYGVAFGPGGDEGVVAVDLNGRTIWEVPKEYVLYRLSSHPSLPGKVLVLGGDWSVLDHDRGGVGRKAGHRSAGLGHLYTHDGVVFPEPEGGVGVIVVGVSFRDVPHVVRCDERGNEVWRADLSEQAEEVVLLGKRAGKFVFAAALEDRAIVVFDEDGTLLDQAIVPGEPGGGSYHVFAFDGGEVSPGRGVITIDTNLGDFLIEVDLDG